MADLTPADVARLVRVRRGIERELALKAREEAERIARYESIAGNARFTLTPAARKSRTPAANTLRKYAR